VTSEPVRSFASRATDPYERGHDLGTHCAEQVRGTLRAYAELWSAYGVTPTEVRAVGTAVLDPVQVYAPDLRAEMSGIAAGSGLSDWEIGALNARSELIALGDRRLVAAGQLPGEGAPVWSECSTLARLDAPPTRARSAGPITAQTWDWHTPLAEHWFVWSLRRPDGRLVHTLTEYGIVGKIGIAGHRAADGAVAHPVSVHFNALRHCADTGTGGVPVHVVARRILDEAQSLDDALALAGKAEVTASAAVTVTAPGGGGWAASTLELRPGGLSLAPAVDGWLAHTNHFIAPDVPDSEQLSTAVSTTRQRLDRIRRLGAGDTLPDRDDVVARLATHDLGPRSVCVHGFPDAPIGQRTATLAVAVTEPADLRLSVHAGKPCEVRRDGWWSSA